MVCKKSQLLLSAADRKFERPWAYPWITAYLIDQLRCRMQRRHIKCNYCVRTFCTLLHPRTAFLYFLMRLSRITHVEEDYCHKTARNLAAALANSLPKEWRIPRFIGHSDSKEVSSSLSREERCVSRPGRNFILRSTRENWQAAEKWSARSGKSHKWTCCLQNIVESF